MRIPIRKYAKYGRAFLVKHSADILTAFTAAGVVITALETRKSTLAAEEYLRANGYYDDNGMSQDTKRVLKLKSTKKYVVPVVTGAATIAAAIGANYINHKQIAGLAAACAAAETALTEHRDKIEELMGDKAIKKIDDEILADKGDRIMSNSSNAPIINTGHGSILCIEGLTGQRFLASPDWVYHARNVFNERVNEDTYASYGEFLEILWEGTKAFIPERYYDRGYNVHVNGIMRLKQPHWEGDADEDAYMIFEPENEPIANYMKLFPKEPNISVSW